MASAVLSHFGSRMSRHSMPLSTFTLVKASGAERSAAYTTGKSVDGYHSPEATSLISKLSLEDQVAFSLGRMVIRFASLEAITRPFLVQLLGLSNEDEERVQAIVGGLSFRKLRETLLAVARQQIGARKWSTS